MKKLFILFLLLLLMPPVFAENLTCPSESQIKRVKLIKAMQNPYDPTCWDFISHVFRHAGKEWNVGFGTFLPDAKTPAEALKQGQAYFDQSPLIIKEPQPVDIPHKILCDYMPTGRLYWVSALSPPANQ
ncbi:hypothetical protein [Aquicella lusitana]|uniref:Uncharacterized protein n=1 Tax=Aquicella lusitana TaxID=254246 RepID=A0A370H133_9COXI|nr:hypothetical protein [Aquicella lusitana]RDI48694.1 hypothetical protein C8D86_102123 [Aquicella lusitana]VVC73929.1 hypothetical protein AQULUS_16900 [Aquicella lusitana]